MNAKTLTLRVTPEVYRRADALAKERGLSLNRIFQEGLELLYRHEREKSLFDDFSRIAEAAENETSVEFALSAQAETVIGP
jgi:HicB family